MSSSDPVRWLESDDAPLSLEARRALRALAEQGPSAEQRARMLAGGLTLMVTPRAPAPARWHGVWWLAGGALVGALMIALSALPVSEKVVTPARPMPTKQVGAPEVNAPPLAPVVTPATPISELPARDGAVSADPQPAPRARPSAARVLPAAGDPVAELALLTPARKLLATQPTRALALSAEHARRFPQGAFAEERAFLRIEALLRLARRAEAEQAARAFRRAHPASTYLERLDGLLTQP